MSVGKKESSETGRATGFNFSLHFRSKRVFETGCAIGFNFSFHFLRKRKQKIGSENDMKRLRFLGLVGGNFFPQIYTFKTKVDGTLDVRFFGFNLRVFGM